MATGRLHRCVLNHALFLERKHAVMKQLIVPSIWLDSEAEEAAKFYTRLLDGRIGLVSHYPESFDNPGGKAKGSVLTVDFEAGGHKFTALNGGPVFTLNPSVSFFLHSPTAAETNQLFAALSEGGEILMPLDAYAWSVRYAWVRDRYGVSWQLITGREWNAGTRVVPCLMFANSMHGRAEEAIVKYTRTFPQSEVEHIERYKDGPGPIGKVVHGRFRLCGQPFAAMDSHESNGASFNEGLSLQVICKDQQKVDDYWAKLSDGGSTGDCGWLRDRFGLSWQIVPEQMERWMTSTDTLAKDRAFAAMLKMKKLDIAALETAFRGQ